MAASFVLPPSQKVPGEGASREGGAAAGAGAKKKTAAEEKAEEMAEEAMAAWREGLMKAKTAFLFFQLLEEQGMLDRGLKKGKEVKIALAKAWKLASKGKGEGQASPAKVRLEQCNALAEDDKKRYKAEMKGPPVAAGAGGGEAGGGAGGGEAGGGRVGGLVPAREAYAFFLLLLRPVLVLERGDGAESLSLPEIGLLVQEEGPARWEVEQSTEGQLWAESARLAAADADRFASEAKTCLAA
jgi:hypothetical protein